MRSGVWFVLPVVLGCGGSGEDDSSVLHLTETLSPEPAGAPSDAAGGRLSCLGDNAPQAPTEDAIVLSGYVRPLSDPDASALTLEAPVEAYASDGVLVGTTASNPDDGGRVAVTISIGQEGFSGHVRVTHTGYFDMRLQSSRPTTSSLLTGWAFMITPAEADVEAGRLGLSRDDARGQLVGSVHDCDGFGIDDAVVTVDGSSDGVAYIVGFEVSPTATWTSASGRFVVPNLPPGPTTVKAWGREAAGEPLMLLSVIDTVITEGAVTAVSLEPRVGLDH